MGRLENKVTIITGSASGVGKEASRLFAKEGAKVAIVDIDKTNGEKVAQDIRENSGDARYWYIDVSKEDSVKSTFKEIHDTFGKIDVLINNAGITGELGRTHETTEAGLDSVFAIDFRGVFFCTKHAVPYFLEQGHGNIINMASNMGLLGGDSLTSYRAAKAATIGLTRQDAVSYAKDHIRVNGVLPGPILTELLQKFLEQPENGGYDNAIKNFTKDIPTGVFCSPMDVAYLLLYLATDESKQLTGALINIDGAQIYM